MSGRKNKNRQRRQQQPGQSTELLDELNSLRDLLGSEALGDIPLLDRVAEPAPAAGKPEPPPQSRPAQAPQPRQEPLDESDLPILFSPVDEELPEDYKPELDESDRKLLQPLRELPADSGPAGEQEQQRELFGEPEPPAAAENPFLPAHIRARLTGGRMPKAGPEPETAADAPETAQPQAAPTVEPEPPTADELPQGDTETVAGSDNTNPDSADSDSAATAAADRQRQRQQLIDRLVAQQLPELERQLRARIERMVDELEARDR